MPTSRIMQAAREILVLALTNPQITYQQSLGAGNGWQAVMLPTTSVVPRNVWELGDDAPPTPYVCLAVRSRGMTSRFIDDRRMLITFWIVAENEDEAYELYEAIRTVINLGDQDPGFCTKNLSRQGSATTLGAIFRELIEVNVYAPAYDRVTSRYQLVAEYAAVAQ